MTLPLTRAIALALICPTFFASAEAEHTQKRTKTLDEIVVQASPLGESADQSLQPVAVLSGKELSDQSNAQIGQVVEQIPGVQASFFGAGVSRPIIRGLEGARVQVLSSGLSSLDASTISPDHAVSIEPFLADQIEVLKGPATLLYGSGAIAGVVNIADGRLPEQASVGPTGRAEFSGDTVADQRLGALRLDYGVEAGAGSWMLHVDAVERDQNDYEIPDSTARQAGTSLENQNAAVSVSYFGPTLEFGLAISKYDSLYGIPEAEVEQEQDQFGAKLGAKSGEEGVRIDLDQHRLDARFAIQRPDQFFEKFELRASDNDYQHVEIEGGEFGTLFDVQSQELRIESVHKPMIAQGKGAIGLTYAARDFAAIGEEAFVPFSKSNNLGLFAVQHIESGPWHSDFGIRFERVRLRPERLSQRTDHLSSVSLATAWEFSEATRLTLNLDRAERAPVAEELLSEGAHIATQSFERGNDQLREETANNVELGLHYHSDRTHLSISAYQNRFDDFIYQADTTETIEGLPLRIWSQADARFRGFEAQAVWSVFNGDNGHLRAGLQLDRVSARLDGGERLPRIAPARVGAHLQWELGDWHTRLSALRYQKQNDVGPFETITDGFTRVDFDVSRGFSLSNDRVLSEVFLKVRNSTDQLARSHTSFLKDLAPLPGRNIALGLRFYW